MRGKIRAFISDLPALAKFCNTIQFNGEYGCLACLDKGEFLTSKKKRIFSLSNDLRLRTNEKYLQDASNAENLNYYIYWRCLTSF